LHSNTFCFTINFVNEHAPMPDYLHPQLLDVKTLTNHPDFPGLTVEIRWYFGNCEKQWGGNNLLRAKVIQGLQGTETEVVWRKQ